MGSWQEALGMVFICGVISLIIHDDESSEDGHRIDSDRSLRSAISAGIGTAAMLGLECPGF